MAVKHLYKVRLDVKSQGRWFEDWITVRVVANGDLRQALNKAERVAKQQGDYQKTRAISIERLSEIDSV